MSITLMDRYEDDAAFVAEIMSCLGNIAWSSSMHYILTFYAYSQDTKQRKCVHTIRRFNAKSISLSEADILEALKTIQETVSLPGDYQLMFHVIHAEDDESLQKNYNGFFGCERCGGTGKAVFFQHPVDCDCVK
jgi:hypothetical protein